MSTPAPAFLIPPFFLPIDLQQTNYAQIVLLFQDRTTRTTCCHTSKSAFPARLRAPESMSASLRRAMPSACPSPFAFRRRYHSAAGAGDLCHLCPLPEAGPLGKEAKDRAEVGARLIDSIVSHSI